MLPHRSKGGRFQWKMALKLRLESGLGLPGSCAGTEPARQETPVLFLGQGDPLEER